MPMYCPENGTDPLTIPPPVFRLPRFGIPDHLIYRAEQNFELRLIQSPPLSQAKTGSAGVHRQMGVESSGGSPTHHDPPRSGSVRRGHSIAREGDGFLRGAIHLESMTHEYYCPRNGERVQKEIREGLK